MTLPKILSRLAELEASRFRWVVHIGGASFFVTDHALPIYLLKDGELKAIHKFPLLCIEQALREACDSRGWGWSVQSNTSMGAPYDASIALDEGYYGEGDSPALALAAALIQAIEADVNSKKC